MFIKLHTGLAGLAITLGLIACSPDDPLTPRTSAPRTPATPQLAVVDGTNGGADAFRWLPPFTATADWAGTNDDAAAPTVEVCVPSGAACTTIATSGANLPAPELVAAKKDEGAHFKLSWKTSLYSLDPALPYRIVVRRGAVQQGFADIDVVPTLADLASVPQGFVGVVVGDVFEIRFRIVRGISRTWVGGAVDKGKNVDPASATAWANGANWSPAGVPFRLDTVVVPATANKPVLMANTAVHSIAVLDGGKLDLGPYNITLTGDVSTAGSGLITATSGFLGLDGIAKTIAGTLPRMRVNGSYSLAGDVTTTASVRLQGGRLRMPGFRLRVTNDAPSGN